MAVRFMYLISVIIMFHSCSFSKYAVVEYIDVLDKYDIYDASIKKVQIDPSYKYPYNVYIKFSLDKAKHKEFFNEINLLTKQMVDTNEMKKEMNIDEYQLFFVMSSINKSRIPDLEKTENDLRWWPKSFEGQIYASSYLDLDSIKKPVYFTQKKNGRIVATIKGLEIFILIECWG